MKCSIITPCFNEVKSIIDTIKSIKNQSYTHIEHLVIDGGSTDGTVDVLKESNVFFISDPDGGIYDAMNRGILLSTGDMIGFLGAGDTYAHDNVIRDVMIYGHMVDAVYGDAKIGRRRYNSGRFSLKRLANGWMPAHTALFVRGEVYRRIGLYRKDYKISGDFEWVVRAFGKGGISYRYLPEILTLMPAGGASNGSIRKKIILNREALRACKDNQIKTSIFKLAMKYPYKLLEYFDR